MVNVNIELTKNAQFQIKHAIKWRAKSQGESAARDAIKFTITDWRNQLLVMPECGRHCEHYDSSLFREIIKGDYRFIYELRKNGDSFSIYLLIFCHVKMDYQTLIQQSYP